MDIMIGGLSLFVWIGWIFGVLALTVFIVLVVGLYTSGLDKEAIKAKKEELKVAKENRSVEKAKKKSNIVIKGAKISKEDQVRNVFGSVENQPNPAPTGFNPGLKRDTGNLPATPASPNLQSPTQQPQQIPPRRSLGNFDEGTPKQVPQTQSGGVSLPPRIDAPRPSFSPPGLNRPAPITPQVTNQTQPQPQQPKVVLPPGMANPKMSDPAELQHLLDEENKEDDLFNRFRNMGK